MNNTKDKYSTPEREELLRRYNEAYRNGNPEITDAEYDQMWRNHQAVRAAAPELFPTDTILDKVGAAPAESSGFQKVKHTTPMLSLDNVFENEEDGCAALNDWLAGIADTDPEAVVMIEPKIDGLSLRLTYVGGLLMRAVTRGSGCLVGITMLELERGGSMPIVDVVEQRVVDRVRALDITTGELVWSDISGHFCNGEVEDWVEVTATGGDKIYSLRLTPGHQVATAGGFVRAGDLTAGDQIIGY